MKSASDKLILGIHMHEGLDSSRRAIDGVIRYINEHRDELVLRNFNFPNDDTDTSGDPPWKGKADGVVVSVARIDGIVPWLKRGKAPLANTSGDLRDDRSIVSVHTDSRSIAKMATDHLLSLELKEIGYVGHAPSDISQERRDMFAVELQKHGYKLKAYETKVPLTGTFVDFKTLGDVEPGLISLLEKMKRPCGIFALNDRHAVSVEMIAQAMGLSVPGDLAILGTGDLEESRLASPPISSIRTNLERMGYEAARVVHRLMTGRRIASYNVTVPVMELAPRESTLGKQKVANIDIDRAIDFIQKRAVEKIRVEDVAQHVRMPLRTFELAFNKATGRTVGDEIRKARVQRAKLLLETTNLPVRSIAKLVGLTDAANLNRFFKRWTDTTVTEFRQQFGGKNIDE